uniref:Uncharacterized protein n=1 Tax=Haptolina ericina TaxID=156174 RepID=A0A7S3F711_9EUKA
MPKFSKFVHGTAFLNRHEITELPYWWAPAMIPLWADMSLSRPVPARMVAQPDDDHDDGPEWARLKDGWPSVVSTLGSRLKALFLRVVTCDDSEPLEQILCGPRERRCRVDGFGSP